jgi:seryl-tRNA synthetase
MYRELWPRPCLLLQTRWPWRNLGKTRWDAVTWSAPALMLALRHLPSTLRARHTLAARSTLTRIRCYSTKPEILDSELPKPRLDYKGIVENTVSKAHNAAKRNAPLPVGAVESVGDLYTEWKQISGDLNERRHMRSSLGNKIRQSAKDPAAKQAALEHAKTLKAQVTQLEAQVSDVEDRLLELALGIPNDTHPLSPIGPESAAITLSTHGPSPIPADPKRDHVSVGKALGMLDLEAGAMVTGSSWYYLINDGALLELALTNYALSIATKHGFKPVLAPDVVRADIARRCGFQPRDANGSQMYHIADSNPELVLSGTAEIPLAGLFANRILPPDQVPTKLVGLGRAFRAEAGARGADTRGLYRVHQFSKLELFVCCQGEVATSEKLMEEMRRIQIEIFKGLEIPFR